MKYAINYGLNNFDPEVYPGATLQGCVPDSVDMYDISVDAGYKATRINDDKATSADFRSKMAYFAKILKNGDSLLISFSGHGTFDESNKERITGLCFYDRVVWDFETKQMLKAFKKGVNIIWVTDSCFSQDNFKFANLNEQHGKPKFFLFDKVAQFAPKLTEITNSKDIQCNIVAYLSSNQYQPSYDMGANGVFTKAFKENYWKKKAGNFYKLYLGIQKSIGLSGYPQTPVFQVVNGNEIKITYKYL